MGRVVQLTLGDGDSRDHRIVLVGVPPEDLIHPPKLVPGRTDPVKDHEKVDVGLGVGVPAGP
jgi:hypothetical protein